MPITNDTLIAPKKLLIFFRKTYQLGKQDHFNGKFGDRSLNFTFLVPSNQAWDYVQSLYSTAYKVRSEKKD